jgi:tetratricopeptide (TPR) repeat protein
MYQRATVIGGAGLLVFGLAAATWLAVPGLPQLFGFGTAPPTPDALPIPPVPPRIAQGADYDNCLDMLGDDPMGADAFATSWEKKGGGDGAMHCHALAQIELGNPVAGAKVLEALGGGSRGPALARAVIYGQAGQAWLMAGDAQRAFDATTLALNLSPDDPDLLIDRAVAANQIDRYQDAVDDLDHALFLEPRRADALIDRAVALRHLNDLNPAMADINRAFIVDPQNPEAFLERGILRERTGDLDGARSDWEHAAALSPDTSTADLAQQNLALLEAGPEQR